MEVLIGFWIVGSIAAAVIALFRAAEFGEPGEDIIVWPILWPVLFTIWFAKAAWRNFWRALRS